MLYFKKTDIFNETRENLDLFHEFRQKYHLETTPDEPLMVNCDWEELQKQYYNYNGFQVFDYRIFDDNTVIGSFSFYFYKKSAKSYTGNEKRVNFIIELLRNYHQQGLESKALKIMYDECKNLNKEIFLSERQNIDNKQFFESIEAEIVQTEIRTRLELEKIDYSMIKKWIGEAKEQNPETQVIAVEGAIPDKLEHEYTKAFNDIVHEMPLDDIEKKRKEFTVADLKKIEEMDRSSRTKTLTVIAIEKPGLVSGITITKMVSSSKVILYQGVSGVPLAFRGRKLGKWVKAQMVLYVKEKFPEVKAIITGNSSTNGPMLYINEKLGFKRYSELNSFQITFDNLKKYLDLEKIEPIEILL